MPEAGIPGAVDAWIEAGAAASDAVRQAAAVADAKPAAEAGWARDARVPSRDAATHDAGLRDVSATRPRALCSGCAGEWRDPSDQSVRVHHIHLNVKSAREAIEFYAKFFGTEPVWLNDREAALWAEPMLFLLEEVGHDFPDALTTGLEHVGLGSRDPVGWFEEASKQGMVADPRNGAPDGPSALLMPLPRPLSEPLVKSDEYPFVPYVYVKGPNLERIEVWASDVEVFWHVHFMTADVDAAVSWYQQLLRAPPVFDSSIYSLGVGNGIALNDEIVLFFASWPEIPAFDPSDERPLGHIAFSVNDLDTSYAQAQASGLSIVSEPAQTQHGFRSFFLRAPDKVLVELVEAGPIRFGAGP